MVKDAMDKVKLIHDRMRAAQNRQKSYADNRRRELEFDVGDHVFLEVSPFKGIIRFGKREKNLVQGILDFLKSFDVTGL